MSKSTPPLGLEKLLGDNNALRDPAIDRARLEQMEGRVCRIELRGSPKGTGFLIGPDLVLTAFHVVKSVIRDRSLADALAFRFDYKVGDRTDIRDQQLRTLAKGDSWLVDHAQYSEMDSRSDPKPEVPAKNELDFAVMRLADNVGYEHIESRRRNRGWVELSERAPDYQAIRGVIILQHPRGEVLKLAGKGTMLTVADEGLRVRYTVATDPGASGSPVFDADLRLIAMHHAGDPDKPGKYNQGIPIALIAARKRVAAALPSHAPGCRPRGEAEILSRLLRVLKRHEEGVVRACAPILRDRDLQATAHLFQKQCDASRNHEPTYGQAWEVFQKGQRGEPTNLIGPAIKDRCHYATHRLFAFEAAAYIRTMSDDAAEWLRNDARLQLSLAKNLAPHDETRELQDKLRKDPLVTDAADEPLETEDQVVDVARKWCRKWKDDVHRALYVGGPCPHCHDQVHNSEIMKRDYLGKSLLGLLRGFVPVDYIQE